jgi:hypothetical protein
VEAVEPNEAGMAEPAVEVDAGVGEPATERKASQADLPFDVTNPPVCDFSLTSHTEDAKSVLLCAGDHYTAITLETLKAAVRLCTTSSPSLDLISRAVIGKVLSKKVKELSEDEKKELDECKLTKRNQVYHRNFAKVVAIAPNIVGIKLGDATWTTLRDKLRTLETKLKEFRANNSDHFNEIWVKPRVHDV